MPAAATNAWALFLDGNDFTDYVDSERISVRTTAHAATGTMAAEVEDLTGALSVTTNMDAVLTGRKSTGGSTTMAASSIVGATNVKVTAVTSLNVGDEVVLGEHPFAELRTISIVGTAGSGGTGITVSVPLARAHSNGDQFYEVDRLFAGYIRRTVGRTRSGTKVWKITARDYTDLLAADVIDVAFRSVAESDKQRVTWLVQNWGFKGVTAGTEVIQTLANMPLGEDGTPEQDFSGKSLQRAIEQIEKITFASHYVDEHRRLHYFATENNAAPYSLSTSPNDTSSFGYYDFELPSDSVDTVNAVYVYGAVLSTGQIRGWRPAAASELLANPGFEVNTTGWTGTGATIARDGTWANSGAWSLKITTTAALAYVYPPTHAIGGATAGRRFVGRATFYVPPGSTAIGKTTVFTMREGGGVTGHADQVTNHVLVEGVQTVTCEMTVVQNDRTAVQMYPFYHPVGGVAGEVLYLDDASIVALPALPPAATRRAVVIRDTDVTSMTELATVGDAYLADHSADKRDGSLKTRRSGFRAGQTVQITNDDWGLAATSFYIQQVALSIEKGVPVYDLQFGNEAATLGGTLGGAVTAADNALRVAAEAPSAAVAAAIDLTAGGNNMVPNSSFEATEFGAWTIGSGWVYSFEPVSPELAYSGRNTARVVTTGTAAGGLISPVIPVDPLDDWWFSVWVYVRSRSAGTLQVILRPKNAANALLGNITFGTFTAATTGWVRVAIHMGPNTELGRTAWPATTAKVDVYADAITSPTLTADLDGFQAERGHFLTAYAPSAYELADASVYGDHVAGGAIGSTHIADDSITTQKLSTEAVDATKIAANAIVAGKIAAGVITSTHISTMGLDAGLIKSGELHLGGLTDAPDWLIVYDSAGEEIGRWGEDGLLIADAGNPMMKMRLMNGELQFASEVDGGGNPLWTTAISADGISADAIRLGTFPGGSNRILNSGFEIAVFSSQLTKLWTTQADFAALGTGLVNTTNTAAGNLEMTSSTY